MIQQAKVSIKCAEARINEIIRDVQKSPNFRLTHKNADFSCLDAVLCSRSIVDFLDCGAFASMDFCYILNSVHRPKSTRSTTKESNGTGENRSAHRQSPFLTFIHIFNIDHCLSSIGWQDQPTFLIGSRWFILSEFNQMYFQWWKISRCLSSLFLLSRRIGSRQRLGWIRLSIVYFRWSISVNR